MNEFFKSAILEKTGASSLLETEIIQELWSGYGQIIRLSLQNADLNSVVVKHVCLPTNKKHPRGWNSEIGHQRKVKSYEVETQWYQKYSHRSAARVPECIMVEVQNDEVLIVLEDLDENGYHLRKQHVDWKDVTACLRWLAQFHASFMDRAPDDLWEQGTYWHLATRPRELEALKDEKLRQAAYAIDEKLSACMHKTLVHGDAKLANFCFAANGKVAAVDFQYVGGGCGMKDVAYFIGSCLTEGECERLEEQILDTYFAYLNHELGQRCESVEAEWRPLYRVAWADFHRFIKGWSPDHWKINSYSERLTAEVIRNHVEILDGD